MPKAPKTRTSRAASTPQVTRRSQAAHQCARCDKSFSRKSDLTRHERTHTGEKPYICDVCTKGFAQSSALKIHMNTHTGAKPYLCAVCLQGFGDPSSRTRHQIEIHGSLLGYDCPFLCMQQGCNASTTRYKRLDQVKSHVRSVHKKDPKLFDYFKLFSNDTTSAPSPAVLPTVKRPAKRTRAPRSAASNTVRREATSSTTPAPASIAVRAAASTSASSLRSRSSPDAHVPCPDSPPPTGYQYATLVSYSDDARSCQRTNSFSDASSQYSDVSSQYSDAGPQYGYHYSGVPHHAFYSGPASNPMYVPGGSYPSTSYYANTGVRPYAIPQRGGLTGSFGALPEQSYPELDPMHEFIDPVLLDIDQLQGYQLYRIDNSESAQHQDPRILLNPPVPELSPSSSHCHTQSSAAPSPLVIPRALIPSSSKVDIPRYQRDRLVWSDIYDRDDVSPTSGFFGRLS